MRTGAENLYSGPCCPGHRHGWTPGKQAMFPEAPMRPGSAQGRAVTRWVPGRLVTCESTTRPPVPGSEMQGLDFAPGSGAAMVPSWDAHR